MAEIIKEIKYKDNDLSLEILRYSKDEMPRDRKANISLEIGFNFDNRFTKEELKQLGWWLLFQVEKLK